MKRFVVVAGPVQTSLTAAAAPVEEAALHPLLADLARRVGGDRLEECDVVFPEQNTRGKILETITHATGTRLGQPLIADGNGTGSHAGFEAMTRYNITAVTQALTPP